MKLFATLASVALAASKEDIKTQYQARANKMCTDFLTGLNAASNTIETKYLANGAQAVIYTCETGDSSFTGSSENPPVPNKSVLKIYFDGGDIDLNKIEKIDKGLTAQDLRYPVYEYVHLPASTDPEWPKTTAKFEEFLSNRKDFEEQAIEPKEARLEIAKRFGKLHSATDIAGVSKTEYREAGKGWWNTYETKAHLNILVSIIKADWFKTGASLDKLYELTDMSPSTFDDEVDFVTKTLQSYYDGHADDKWLVMCHNDPHGGNIMRNKDDPFDPTKLELLDFDNAGYGFRIWDLLYNMVNWNIDYKGDNGETRLIKDINDFFDAYIGEQTYDANLTSSTLWEELGAHAPYFYLERMTFLVAFGIFDPTYHGIMRSLYDDATSEYGHEAKRDSAVSTDAFFASFILPLVYLFL